VETRFSLDRFRGRSIRFRFLVSTVKVQDNPDYLALGFDLDESADDGWYVDDVQVSETLTSAATVSVDTKNNSGLPSCAAPCSVVTPALSADPSAVPAPRTRVVLDASASSVDRCANGILQFQFWIDGDTDGVLGDPDDTLVRDFTDEPVLVVAPMATVDYGVRVRCSTDISCQAGAVTTVTVNCPAEAASSRSFPESIEFANPSTIEWSSEQQVDAVRGDLIALRSFQGFSGTVDECVADDEITDWLDLSGEPSLASGAAYYYLVRPMPEFCNEPASWSTNTSEESPDRDTEIGSDSDRCPP
jgi:hypothetical protein